MKVLVVSEGVHELGDDQTRGALVVLVDRLLDGAAELVPVEFNDARVTVHPGKGDGMMKRALSWLRYAQNEKYDALVVVIDHDGDNKRIRSISDAQENPIFNLPRAMGVAIQKFDAWILADEKALSQVLGVPINCQPDPEELRDPKARFAELKELGTTDDSGRALYAKVCKQVDLDLLARRCPRGFKPFGDRVRRLPTGMNTRMSLPRG